MKGILALCLLAFCIALAGCGHTAPPEPRIVVQRVEVPVQVPCSVDPGPDPQYAWTKERVDAAPGLFALVMILWADHQQRVQREAELKAANSGCRGTP